MIHSLVQANLLWPASSLLQTLLLRSLKPSEVFDALFSCYEKCKLSSSSSFDLLIQHYVRSRRTLDGFLVFKMVTKVGLLPEFRTLSVLLHGLVKFRHFGLAMELFNDMINLGIRPDVYIYTGVIRSLCELKIFLELEPRDMIVNIVPYNVLIDGVCKKQKVWYALEIKKNLAVKELKPDVVTSHSVFTITVHIKEESMGDEELIKCGKLKPCGSSRIREYFTVWSSGWLFKRSRRD